ncbi:hypothetical protein [Acutalibacter muris]|jgi:hypothetical protein|uniref:hypothetical protein n=1 Tax=Acutalibacter muris TaxID=1796620 RepID=UPI0026F3964C|nr:hypothetical protein [Acutalibacter muris]
MKKLLALILAATLALSLVACGGGGGTGDTNTPGTPSDGNGDINSPSTPSGDTQQVPGLSEPDESSSPEATVPNNGEWDEILCSGDGYHLVKKEVDAYDGYTIMVGVVNDAGEWVQEMTDTGTFAKRVRFRAMGSSEVLRDSSCYAYLGEGVFLASPGVSVFTKDEEYRVGPWENFMWQKSPIRSELAVWECIFWNVIDNSQKIIDANKISVFQDGYLLFCEEEESLGGGKLYAMNTEGEITELPCQFLPNKPGHNFPVYSEGLFYACSEERSNPGFYDIEGNLVIDLHEYNMGRIFYSSSQEVNAPCFENGQATILFQNNAGSVFKGIIDKTGAFVSEPEKVDVSTY